MDQKLMLENHLHFLSTHRGRQKSLPGLELIHSEKAAFNIAFPLANGAVEKVENTFQIYLPEWSEVSQKELASRHWHSEESYNYLKLEGSPAGWSFNPSVCVQRVQDTEGIEQFSLVQGRGFCENEQEFQALYPWMRLKNIDNYKEKDQAFYTGFFDGKPAGVCLTLLHQNIMGIYAVATLPEYRKQGISTSVMKKAVEDALAMNVDGIILQTITGSYAEAFYLKTGFKKAFTCHIYKHRSTTE